MNSVIDNLILSVVSTVVERGGYVTKTKLLKLIYLFDVEYYRAHGKIFTGFEWKFFHLGPWTSEFDPMLETLVNKETLIEIPSTKRDYDTKFYRTDTVYEPRQLFATFADESILRYILNTWADATTGEILNYVYFHTEPMERGVRSQPLDFSYIVREKPERYARPSSGVSPKVIREQRRRLEERLKNLAVSRPDFAFTPPRYDEEFAKALKKLDTTDL